MIFENGLYGQTQYLLQKSMDVEMIRRNVIADNIANADTPHFKRSHVTFEAELRRTIDANRFTAENTIPTRMTNDRHIPFFKMNDVRDVEAKTQMDYLSTMRNDGNNVDIETEVQDMTTNTLRYQALTTMVTNNFKLLGSVMRTA